MCSRRSHVDSSPDVHSGDINAHQHHHSNRMGSPLTIKSTGGHSGLHKMVPNVAPARRNRDSEDLDDFSFESQDLGERDDRGDKKKLARVLSDKARTAKSRTSIAARKGAAKVNEMGLLLGRAGTVSFGKAVEALDTIGSSMTSLNLGGGFASGSGPKGNKIEILAFEVANTIVKGFNLKLSLSDENMKILKEEILRSEGVQRLVSTDMAELMRIAAADKRNELKIFSGEVVRFGNHCRDPQWHQLDRLFEKLGTEVTVPRQTKEEAEAEMQNLMSMAQYTAELYHELHALDRFEGDYRRKHQEEEQFNSSQRGDSLAILRSELKSQKKHVNNLKKKSLWSKILEEVMEKLVDIVYFLHQEIQNAFGDAGGAPNDKKLTSKERTTERLGVAGLALHYANIINQIDSLVSRPSSVPPNTRDNLYQGLPPNIKASLRTRLHQFPIKDAVTVAQIKGEMEKTLSWLVPVAANTTKAHHGFGWVGEWANTGSALDRRLPGNMDLALLQTLHHADQKVTEQYILELVVWLHHLINLARSNIPGNKSPVKSPVRSPVQQRKTLTSLEKPPSRENGHIIVIPGLSPEDQVMLQDVKNKKFTPGISKSQEFDTAKAKAVYRCNRLSKSSSHSPSTSTEGDFSLPRSHVKKAPFDFEVDRSKALDVIDNI